MRVDILIVGGGIQGLAMLRELSDAGHRCLLVTNGEIGDGQTLHSHGLLNSGIGLVTGETYVELVAHVVPALRQLGVPVYGDERSYLSLPPPMVEQLRPVWAAHGYRPEPVAGEELPEEIQSPWTFYRVPGYHVPKRRLVAALSSRFEPSVVRGEITGARDDTYLVAAGTGADEVEVQADAVVVAAGCGSIPVLQRLGVSTAEIVTRVDYIKSHMICLRAPAGLLPQIGTVATPQLAVVGHFNRDHDTVGADDRVSWYVTPAVGEPTWYDTAPEDAVAEVEAEVVAQGVASLQELFPLLERSAPSVEATVFAGFKQNVDGQMTRRLFSCVEDNRAIYLALPSVLVHAFTNARDAVRAFDGTAFGRSNQLAPVLVHNLLRATVGHVKELKAGVEWLPWTRFREMYRLSTGASGG